VPSAKLINQLKGGEYMLFALSGVSLTEEGRRPVWQSYRCCHVAADMWRFGIACFQHNHS
jgi:hypothetical protein